MKRKFVLAIAILIIAGCSKPKEEHTRFDKGSPAYELAASLSELLPMLNPDSNKVFVTTRYFDVTTADIMQAIVNASGKMAEDLKTRPIRLIYDRVYQIARDVAEQRLILREAEKLNIEVDESSVDTLLNKQMNKFGGEEKFKQWLEETGIRLDFVRQDLRNQLIIDRYLAKRLADYFEITEEDLIEAKKDRTNATVRHIMLMTRGKTEAEKIALRRKMETILMEAKSGEDFAELAKRYSEDPGSKNQGGMYENVIPGRMQKPFEEAAFNTPVGEISDIFETRNGIHILKVIKRDEELRPIDEIRDELKMDAMRKKEANKNQLFRDHVAKLRKEADFRMIEYKITE